MKKYKRPLILAGRGIRASGAIDLFREFVKKYKIPVVTSLLGLDVLPYYSPQRVGFIGVYGNRWANYALGNCDFLLVLGNRLDSRQTGPAALFKGNKEILHVDIEGSELNNNIKGCITVQNDLADYLSQDSLLFNEVPNAWIEEIETEKQKCWDTDELKNIKGINPNIFIHKLSQVSGKAKAFTADVGSNQMWTAQSLEIGKNQLFLTSGGMGAMGYSLPAAIGASLLLGDVVCITGDGGIQINIQELQTIKRNNLPVKIVVLNNHCLGMIRQFQDLYFDGRHQSTVLDYSTPDFVKVATAYGIKSSSVTKTEEIESGLKRLWEHHGAYLLDVQIDTYTNVSPRVKFGNPITKME